MIQSAHHTCIKKILNMLQNDLAIFVFMWSKKIVKRVSCFVNAISTMGRNKCKVKRKKKNTKEKKKKKKHLTRRNYGGKG